MTLPLFDEKEWNFLMYALDLTPEGAKQNPVASPAKKQPQNPRKPKCEIEGCPNRVQSRRRCKRHGGGSPCKIPSCTKPRQGRGYCHMHGGEVQCSVDGCTKGRQKRGLCAAHGGLDECAVLQCKNRARIQGVCRRHFSSLSVTSSVSFQCANSGKVDEN